MSWRIQLLSGNGPAPTTDYPTDYDYLNSDASLIHRSFTNAVKMMTDRGYTIPSSHESIINMGVAQFVDHFKRIAMINGTTFEEQVNILFTAPLIDLGTDQIITVTSGTAESSLDIEVSRPGGLTDVWMTFANSREGTSLSMDRYRQIENDKPDGIDRVIIISEKEPSSHVSNAVEDMTITYEFFTYHDLSADPTKHFLNSKFIKLSPKLVDMLIQELKETNSVIKQLSEMSFQDKMSRWYGAMPGDVFEVLRFYVGVDMIIDYDISWRIVTPRQLPKVRV